MPYLTFTNLYLLAPRAAERLRTPRGVLPEEDAATGGAALPSSDGGGVAPFLSHTCCYSARELRQLAIGARVRLVESRVAGHPPHHLTPAPTLALTLTLTLPSDH